MTLPPDQLSQKVIGLAIKVHRALGPGLLEGIYKACLFHELKKGGLQVSKEVDVPVVYDGMRFEFGFRIDLLIENSLLVELKAVEKVHPVHKAQIISYLRLANLRRGRLLINFHSPVLKDGIDRFWRDSPDDEDLA